LGLKNIFLSLFIIILKLFLCTDIKNKFYKKKFYIFLNKKYFKKQIQSHHNIKNKVRNFENKNNFGQMQRI